MTRWLALTLIALFAGSSIAADSPDTAAANQPQIPTIEFGRGHTEKVYSIKLSALNQDCAEPQDFLFVANGLEFIKVRGSDWLQQIAQGEKRTVEAVIDLRGVAPGEYTGDFQIFCESCGWMQFGNSCRINTRIFRSQFQVLGPQPDMPPQDYSVVPVISDKTRELRQARNNCVRTLSELRFNYALLQKLAEQAYMQSETTSDTATKSTLLANAEKLQNEADAALSGANITAEDCRDLVLQTNASVVETAAD